MGIAEEYYVMESDIKKMIDEADYPSGHPFLDYPNTPESMPLKMLIIIYSFTKNRNMISEFIKKCNGKENGVYSFKKYREGMSELAWLYYLIISIMQTKLTDILNVYDENHKLIDNDSEFEYSFDFDNPSCIVAFEVKSLSCDPFEREKGKIKAIDDQKLVKTFFPQLKNSEFLKTQTDSIVLGESTHYNQIVKNINRINKKCEGNNICGKKLYCFGTLFITASTSFDEFYSYIFNDEYGLYDMIKRSKIDVLIIASLDAKIDLYCNSLYEKGYIQTILPHPTKELMRICNSLRLDNYIALGNDIIDTVKEASKAQYGFYKVLNRNGYINIIPQDATEKEIEDYLQFLENDSIQ